MGMEIRSRDERGRALELRKWLDDNRAEYLGAKTKWSDPAWLQAAVVGNRTVWLALRSYRPGDEPTKAVYILAQAELSLSSVFSQLAIIEAYETNLHDLSLALGQAESETAAALE